VKIDCPYCNGQAKLVDSKEIYRRSYGMIWFCKPCDAWVGTHKDSKKHRPLGRLANSELRHWKQIAHTKFDLLWRAKMRRDKCRRNTARRLGYAWLAKQLGIEVKDCHIGMFDVDQCKRVVVICKNPGR
jgi:hypothetical protein